MNASEFNQNPGRRGLTCRRGELNLSALSQFGQHARVCARTRTSRLYMMEFMLPGVQEMGEEGEKEIVSISTAPRAGGAAQGTCAIALVQGCPYDPLTPQVKMHHWKASLLAPRGHGSGLNYHQMASSFYTKPTKPKPERLPAQTPASWGLETIQPTLSYAFPRHE